MTDFAEFQQKAKLISTYLMRRYGEGVGCVTFFSLLMPANNVSLNDAKTISILAQSLDDTYGNGLLDYVKKCKKKPDLSLEELDQYKEQVLMGIYLLKWFEYNTMVDSYVHQYLIDLFRKHLGVETLEEVEKSLFALCMESLSIYCSYVYENRYNGRYTELEKRLGATIQGDIDNARRLFSAGSSSWYGGIYRGFMDTLGM